MKYKVLIWVEGQNREDQFSTSSTVYADSSIEAVKKVINDVEKLEQGE